MFGGYTGQGESSVASVSTNTSSCQIKEFRRKLLTNSRQCQNKIDRQKTQISSLEAQNEQLRGFWT